MAVNKTVQAFDPAVALLPTDIIPIVQLGTSASAVRTTLGAIKSLVSTITFADATARGLSVPSFVGQLGVQLDNDMIYIATGTSAGNWVNSSPLTYTQDSIITAVSTIANTSYTVLNSIAVPGGIMNTNGDKLKITGYFSTAANANSKTFGVSLPNGTNNYTTVVPSETAYFETELIRQSATLFTYITRVSVGTTNDVTIGAGTSTPFAVGDFASGFTIDAHGTNAVASAGDITNIMLSVEIILKKNV